MTRRRRRRRKSLLRWIGIALVGFVLLTVLPVLLLRWVDPPTSAFMIQRWVTGYFEPGGPRAIQYEWTDWESIPAAVKLAVIASEDQRFPDHRGFDTIEIERAWQHHLNGGRLRGASTISQQTAKNLFLWAGRDPVRKGLEIWLTLLIELLWSKQRILEVYLNVAQLGPTTFGVEAASWRYFHRPAAALGTAQAAMIAAVLPNPKLYRLDAPSAYVTERAAQIRRQMTRLGGAAYLNRLKP